MPHTTPLHSLIYSIYISVDITLMHKVHYCKKRKVNDIITLFLLLRILFSSQCNYFIISLIKRKQKSSTDNFLAKVLISFKLILRLVAARESLYSYYASQALAQFFFIPQWKGPVAATICLICIQMFQIYNIQAGRGGGDHVYIYTAQYSSLQNILCAQR